MRNPQKRKGDKAEREAAELLTEVTGFECKKLHDVLYEAEKSLQNLHGVLYHQINKYGSAYLEQMKQFDAGIYSVSDIDQKVDSLNDQTAYLVDLLQKEVEPNDLVNNE